LVGKVDPEQLDSNWNLSYEINRLEPVAMLQMMIDAGNVYQGIEALKPQHRYYTRLKGALAAYRGIQRRGGWRPVPSEEALKRGMADHRAPLLRQRLAITGDLPEGMEIFSTVFDDALEAAVKRFQKRHRLEADGVVGPDTFAALNTPVAQRIDQLRVNLERARWTLHDLPETFVVVNIADFKVYLIRNGERVWDALAVVGSNFHKTPVFKANMTYLVFNPTWTSPRSITVNEILPKVKRDRTYLQAQSIDVIDRSGNVMDQSRLDWAQYNRNYFPYTLRQRPGPNNALGQVKFIFPNPHSVFLHDTPSRELFSRTRRNFSHGCIRVQHPLKFAKFLLNDEATWSPAAIQEAVASGKTQTVFLPQPLPVLLLYWTAQVDGDGVVSFIPDIYDRDAAVLHGLSEEFKIRMRDVEPDIP
jgi:murein L,D-transpeptidase YcbB/YkuD